MTSRTHIVPIRSASGGARSGLCVVLCALLAATPAHPETARSLGDLSLEELMNESVTSVSRREQKLGDVASAITVLSNEDLRRTPFTTVADALRLVPGVDVGAVNANQWAVSARGFNNLYANKLLVLVDGRAVYTPLFAGVYWDQQQPMLADVDRIEVIRGPGATVWGANAVNGVINVVSRGAQDTQGGLVFGSAGSAGMAEGGVRYGGAAGEDTFYRVYAAYQEHGEFRLADGRGAGDDWASWQGGVRVDRLVEATHLTWQTDVSRATLDDGTSHGYDLSSLGRWTRSLAGGGQTEVQAYYDRTHRDELLRSRSTTDTFDFSFQHTLEARARHSAIWGAGYRYADARIERTAPTVAIGNSHLRLSLFSAFVQDEYQLVPDRLTLTAGVKLEHNDFTGFEAQPSARAVWKPAENHSVWTAVSRAVRTPSALEGKNVFMMEVGPPIPGPDGGWYVPTVTGNADPDSEVVWAYEAGWRWQASRQVSFDLATFYNRYSGIIFGTGFTRFVPGVPLGRAELPFVNAAGAETHGAEASLTIAPTPRWRVTVSQSWLKVDDGVPGANQQFDPEYQTVLRSSHELGRSLSLDLQIRRVSGFDANAFIAFVPIPAYTEADIRLAWRPTSALELSLAGSNLLHGRHVEQGPTAFVITTEVPRQVHADVTWRF